MITRILLAAALVLTTASCDMFQPRNVTSAERAETFTSIGTVREIDRANRRFKLRIGGRTLTIRVNEAVPAFDLMEVGDRVRVTHAEAVAVDMAAPSETGELMGASAEGVFVDEGVIGRGGIAAISGVFEFVSYDRSGNMATLIGPEGNIISVQVAPEMRAFARSRSPGDRIFITYAVGDAIQLEIADN
mgnify:CR=1 FL=1|jgi:hypothetical protein